MTDTPVMREANAGPATIHGCPADLGEALGLEPDQLVAPVTRCDHRPPPAPPEPPMTNVNNGATTWRVLDEEGSVKYL